MRTTERRMARNSARRQPGAVCAGLSLVGLLACSKNSVDTEQLDAASVQQTLLGHTMILPKGFSISVFAQGLSGVRFMKTGPGGEVYASRPGAGLIIRLPDANDDGVPEAPVTVRSGLNNPHGFHFRGDTLYVAEEHQVVRYASAASSAEVLVSGIPTGGHDSRTLAFRGDTMYLSVGSSCNICTESNARRAAVTSFRLDGSVEQSYAQGLRNSVGLAVHPQTGEIWATNNDRDNIGDEIPPDRVNILQKDGFYGWPNCYLPGKANPEFSSNQGPCANAIAPAVELGAHVAPLGLAFYTGTAFPEQYRGALFIAEHGSWNRSASAGHVGYRIEWVPVQNGRPTGPARRFISGWLEGSSSWGRPVDVLPLQDGSLLISDDAGGRIYRVTYQGT
jgi:glucose/arabinose dehydrogenase